MGFVLVGKDATIAFLIFGVRQKQCLGFLPPSILLFWSIGVSGMYWLRVSVLSSEIERVSV